MSKPKKNCYSYKHLPEEITNYAGDQAEDRTSMEDWEALEGAELDYKNQIGCFKTRKGKELFERILYEKTHDILWEVRHGERTDFDRGYLENLNMSGKTMRKR